MSEPGTDFRKIYDAFHARILRYLTRLVGEGEAEDLTQEVFVKINRGLKTFRGEAQLSTWIYRIATHAALDRLRSPGSRAQGTKPTPIPPDGEGGEGLWLDGQRAPAEQRVIREEMNGCIRGMVDALPAQYRSVIVLSELEGLKDAEIAEVLGIRLETVKMRLHRGRVMLKKELSSACVFYRDERNELACDRKGTAELIRIRERGD